MKNNNKKISKTDILEYIELIEKNPEQKKQINKAVQKESKKLMKDNDTYFAGLFLSAIKF